MNETFFVKTEIFDDDQYGTLLNSQFAYPTPSPPLPHQYPVEYDYSFKQEDFAYGMTTTPAIGSIGVVTSIPPNNNVGTHVSRMNKRQRTRDLSPALQMQLLQRTANSIPKDPLNVSNLDSLNSLNIVSLDGYNVSKADSAWTIRDDERWAEISLLTVGDLVNLLARLEVSSNGVVHKVRKDREGSPSGSSVFSVNSVAALFEEKNNIRWAEPTKTFSKVEALLTQHMILQQITNHLVHIYFQCVNIKVPVLQQDTFMEWYESRDTSNSLIVHAICCFVAQHAWSSHPVHTNVKVQATTVEQFYLWKSRELLTECWDTPTSHDVVGLMLLTLRSPKSQAMQFAEIAARSMVALKIQPRKLDPNDEDQQDGICRLPQMEEEMQKRMWWWMYMLRHFWSQFGVVTPMADLDVHVLEMPAAFDFDGEVQVHAVAAWRAVLRLYWTRDEISKLFANGADEVNESEITALEAKLEEWYQGLPSFFKLDSNYVFEHPQSFILAIKVNSELHETTLLLQKPLLPDPHEHNLRSYKSLDITLRSANTLLLLSQSVTKNGFCFWDIWEFIAACSIYMMYKDSSDADLAFLSRACISKALDIMKSMSGYIGGHHTYVKYAKTLEQALIDTGTPFDAHLQLPDHDKFLVPNLLSDYPSNDEEQALDEITQAHLQNHHIFNPTPEIFQNGYHQPLAFPLSPYSPPLSVFSSPTPQTPPPLPIPTSIPAHSAPSVQFISQTASISSGPIPTPPAAPIAPSSAPKASQPAEPVKPKKKKASSQQQQQPQQMQVTFANENPIQDQQQSKRMGFRYYTPKQRPGQKAVQSFMFIDETLK